MEDKKENFWALVLSHLEAGEPLCVLYVLHSEGSSPGRKGFRQFITKKGDMHGSIGGGFMEQKLTELAQSRLGKGEHTPFIRRQIHRTNAVKNKSGMICSGEQTVAFYFLDHRNVARIRDMVDTEKRMDAAVLELNTLGIQLRKNIKMEMPFHFEQKNDEDWCYREQLGVRNTLYIVGAGHVGLALSRVMFQLGFRVEIFDDREGLNTWVANPYVHRKAIVSYDNIETYIPEGDTVYVVLVTFGFRSDEKVLKRLIGRRYKYMGMLGSEEKVAKIFEHLQQEGYPQIQIDSVFSPIGISIFSKTPEEIAVSIAAEIIREKNKPIETGNLPATKTIRQFR